MNKNKFNQKMFYFAQFYSTFRGNNDKKTSEA